MTKHVAPEVNGKQTTWHWDQLTKATKSRMKLLAVRPRPTTHWELSLKDAITMVGILGKVLHVYTYIYIYNTYVCDPP